MSLGFLGATRAIDSSINVGLDANFSPDWKTVPVDNRKLLRDYYKDLVTDGVNSLKSISPRRVSNRRLHASLVVFYLMPSLQPPPPHSFPSSIARMPCDFADLYGLAVEDAQKIEALAYARG